MVRVGSPSTSPDFHLSSSAAAQVESRQETSPTRSSEKIRAEIATIGAELVNAYTQYGIENQRRSRAPGEAELPGSSLCVGWSTRHGTTATVSFKGPGSERDIVWGLRGDYAAIKTIAEKVSRYEALQQELRAAEKSEHDNSKHPNQRLPFPGNKHKRPKWATPESAGTSLLNLPTELFDRVVAHVPETCERDMAGFHELTRGTYQNATLQAKRAYAKENQRAWLRSSHRIPGELAEMHVRDDAPGILRDAIRAHEAEMKDGRARSLDEGGLVYEITVTSGADSIRLWRDVSGKHAERAPADDPQRDTRLVGFIEEIKPTNVLNLTNTRFEEDSGWQKILDQLNSTPAFGSPLRPVDLFQRLSDLCDKQYAMTSGTEIATLTCGVKVLQFEVVPYVGAAPIKMLRDTRDSNSLRIAPSADDPAQLAKVLEKMDQAAQQHLGERLKLAAINHAPDGRIPYVLSR